MMVRRSSGEYERLWRGFGFGGGGDNANAKDKKQVK